MHDPLQESLVLHLFLGSCCMSEIKYYLIMFDWSTKQSGFFLSLIDKWKKMISITIFGREKRNKYIKIIFYQNGISRDTSTRGSPRLRMHWQLQGCPQISHNFIASANFSQFYCLCKFLAILLPLQIWQIKGHPESLQLVHTTFQLHKIVQKWAMDKKSHVRIQSSN